jgi:hypothetical protein
VHISRAHLNGGMDDVAFAEWFKPSPELVRPCTSFTSSIHTKQLDWCSTHLLVNTLSTLARTCRPTALIPCCSVMPEGRGCQALGVPCDGRPPPFFASAESASACSSRQCGPRPCSHAVLCSAHGLHAWQQGFLG